MSAYCWYVFTILTAMLHCKKFKVNLYNIILQIRGWNGWLPITWPVQQSHQILERTNRDRNREDVRKKTPALDSKRNLFFHYFPCKGQKSDLRLTLSHMCYVHFIFKGRKSEICKIKKYKEIKGYTSTSRSMFV